MNKQTLIQQIAQNTGVHQDTTTAVVNGLLQALTQALTEGEEVKIFRFGTLATRTRKARLGRNPKTGKQVQIPAKTGVYFKPGKALDQAINPVKKAH